MTYNPLKIHRVLRGFEALSRPALKRLLPPHAFEAATFRMRMGYRPNLDAPQSFNEEISYRKLEEIPFPHPELVDKLAVRDHVEALVGSEVLTDVLAVYECPEDIRLEALPDAFALKSNTGSGMNLLVDNKTCWSEEALRKACAPWFHAVYSEISYSNERMYDMITPKVYAEEHLGSSPGGVREYKFWCFHGEPVFIQASRIVDGRRVYRLYERDWVPCGFNLFHPPVDLPFPRPEPLERMLECARALSAGHGFVRVDLNVSGAGRVSFSELTFRPGAGRVRFFPREMDFELGRRWRGE